MTKVFSLIKNKNFIITLLVVIVLLAGVFYCFLFTKLSPAESIVRVNNKIIKVELASTPSQQAQGLSGRASLCSDCAMLFVFPEKKPRQFWMKEMNFPLDIVWLNENKVVGVTYNLLAPKLGESPQIATSTGPVNYVLELNAGMAEYYGLKNGQEVVYQINNK